MSSSRTHFRARCKSSPFVPERFNLPGDSVPFFFALMARLLSDACQRHGESGFFHFLNSLETPIYRNKILNGVGCHPSSSVKSCDGSAKQVAKLSPRLSTHVSGLAQFQRLISGRKNARLSLTTCSPIRRNGTMMPAGRTSLYGAAMSVWMLPG